MHPYAHCSIIYITTHNMARFLSLLWMNDILSYIFNTSFASIKEKKTLLYRTTWVDFEGVMQIEIN